MKQVFSSCVPLVKAGNPVAINVTQTLDGRLTQDGPATVHVRIDGPQTSLLADMVAGVFPAPGSDQSPDEFLPHVAFVAAHASVGATGAGPRADDAVAGAAAVQGVGAAQRRAAKAGARGERDAAEGPEHSGSDDAEQADQHAARSPARPR